MIKLQKFESNYEKPIDNIINLYLSLIDEYLQYKERDIFTQDNRQILEAKILSVLEYLKKMFDDARINFSGENLRRDLQE